MAGATNDAEVDEGEREGEGDNDELLMLIKMMIVCCCVLPVVCSFLERHSPTQKRSHTTEKRRKKEKKQHQPPTSNTSAMTTTSKKVFIVASGDSRPSANVECWPAQAAVEAKLTGAISRAAQAAQMQVEVKRAHAYDTTQQHGFIWSQRMGLDVFRAIPRDAAVIVVEAGQPHHHHHHDHDHPHTHTTHHILSHFSHSNMCMCVCARAVWQYSYFVTGGLLTHNGPILTVSNFEGTWPGLVGMLNLNASLTKMGKQYSTLWSATFEDADTQFMAGLTAWLTTGAVVHHPTDHVRPFDVSGSGKHGEHQQQQRQAIEIGVRLGKELKERKAILGVFDEGCMGMMNGILEDALLNACGIFKERLSQSALVAAMGRVSEQEAWEAFEWCRGRGMRFEFGHDPATELTVDQTLEQFKMYIAAARIAHDMHCDVIGIQYQQGLKDVCPASDLAEGLLNDTDRPPVYALGDRRVGGSVRQALFEGKAIPHFNEVDEGAGVDALVTNIVWSTLGLDPATTLHDIRWGEEHGGQFVWVFLISGAVPPSHLEGGYGGATSERQSPMYFPGGGGTIKGVSRAGEIVWSRVFAADGRLHADVGTATVVQLPREETERRWRLTTPQWPIMSAVLHGVTRDQMMARHKSNHIQVAYARDAATARMAAFAKAAMFAEMGLSVSLCGDV
jgi:hypothetical protein